MIIRDATIEDAEALARIHIDSWRAAYCGLVPDFYLENLDYDRLAEKNRKSFRTNETQTHIAELNSVTVGLLTLGKSTDPDVDCGDTGEIFTIYLAPKYWRKGIGTRLCQWAEDQLVSLGYAKAVLWVFLDNDQARNFYEAMGFTPDGGSKLIHPGKELEVIRYRKQLKKAEPEGGLYGENAS